MAAAGRAVLGAQWRTPSVLDRIMAGSDLRPAEVVPANRKLDGAMLEAMHVLWWRHATKAAAVGRRLWHGGRQEVVLRVAHMHTAQVAVNTCIPLRSLLH